MNYKPKLPRKNFHRASHKAFHFPFTISILPSFPQFPQSTPENCRLIFKVLILGRGSGRRGFQSLKNLIPNGQPTRLAGSVGLYVYLTFKNN